PPPPPTYTLSLHDALPIWPPDLVPARMLNEVVYCPRLFWLENVGGEFEDSADTIHGRRVHRRVDGEPSPLPPDIASTGLVSARSDRKSTRLNSSHVAISYA